MFIKWKLQLHNYINNFSSTLNPYPFTLAAYYIRGSRINR